MTNSQIEYDKHREHGYRQDRQHVQDVMPLLPTSSEQVQTTQEECDDEDPSTTSRAFGSEWFLSRRRPHSPRAKSTLKPISRTAPTLMTLGGDGLGGGVWGAAETRVDSSGRAGRVGSGEVRPATQSSLPILEPSGNTAGFLTSGLLLALLLRCRRGRGSGASTASAHVEDWVPQRLVTATGPNPLTR